VEFAYGPVVEVLADRSPKVFMTTRPILPKFSQQLIFAVADGANVHDVELGYDALCGIDSQASHGGADVDSH